MILSFSYSIIWSFLKLKSNNIEIKIFIDNLQILVFTSILIDLLKWTTFINLNVRKKNDAEWW